MVTIKAFKPRCCSGSLNSCFAEKDEHIVRVEQKKKRKWCSSENVGPADRHTGWTRTDTTEAGWSGKATPTTPHTMAGQRRCLGWAHETGGGGGPEYWKELVKEIKEDLKIIIMFRAALNIKKWYSLPWSACCNYTICVDGYKNGFYQNLSVWPDLKTDLDSCNSRLFKESHLKTLASWLLLAAAFMRALWKVRR